MEPGLEGRACVVTGASRGIGRATARRLASKGADVLLVGRDAAALAEAAAEAGGVALVADVTEPDAAERIVATCVERFGALHVLVNNAGAMTRRPLDELSDTEWQAQWDLNVMGPMRLMRAGAPHMVEAGYGRIVNVSSSAGKRPSRGNAAYSVTKAAQLSLSRVYADALAPQGVLVNAIAPGPVATELWTGPGGIADQVASERGVAREEAVAAHAGGLPVRRLGSPEEIADVIVFLCSPAASFVAGVAWSVDGGAVATIV